MLWTGLVARCGNELSEKVLVGVRLALGVGDVGVSLAEDAWSFDSASFSFFSVCAMRNALSISTGKSATPIIMFPIVPIKAAAAPVNGSQGPSSVSYSRDR